MFSVEALTEVYKQAGLSSKQAKCLAENVQEIISAGSDEDASAMLKILQECNIDASDLDKVINAGD